METARHARGYLILAAVVTLVAWQFPEGRLALYPFSFLATFAHEMGHGIMAMLVGGHFDALKMYPDGSGLAEWRGDVGRIGRALVAAGGLVGPSVAGAALLVLSRRAHRARWLLFAIAAAMAASVVLVVRSSFGVVFLALTALALTAVARFLGKTAVAPFLVQLVGVQLCLAVFRDVRYMFSPGGVVDGTLRPSDSAQIAEALWLPYWVWGAVVALFSFAVLALGLYLAVRTTRERIDVPVSS